jgi:hypothetical protein
MVYSNFNKSDTLGKSHNYFEHWFSLLQVKMIEMISESVSICKDEKNYPSVSYC